MHEMRNCTVGLACVAFTNSMIVEALADAPSPGNLLISSDNRIVEYTPDGAFVRQLVVPTGSWDDPARDLALTGDGRLRLYNGTFNPHLSTFDFAGGDWSHERYAGWSTISNISYGGIAVAGSDTFVTDMRTAGGGEPQGIVRFRDGAPAVRFAEDIEPIDLNIGLDGLLYALHPGGSPGGRSLDVYEPEGLTFVRRINLTDPVSFESPRGVAVDAGGRIFLVTWGGEAFRLSPAGGFEARIQLRTLGMNDLFDVEVAGDGTVVIGDRFGNVAFTDTQFSSVRAIELTSDGVFVTLVAEAPCAADLDGDGDLTVFDFLAFQNAFDAGC